MTELNNALIDAIKWNSQGLVPAIAQDANSKKVKPFIGLDHANGYGTKAKPLAIYKRLKMSD